MMNDCSLEPKDSLNPRQIMIFSKFSHITTYERPYLIYEGKTPCDW